MGRANLVVVFFVNFRSAKDFLSQGLLDQGEKKIKRRGGSNLMPRKTKETKETKETKQRKTKPKNEDIKEAKEVKEAKETKEEKRKSTRRKQTDDKDEEDKRQQQQKRTKFRNQFASVDDALDKSERFADCEDDLEYNDLFSELEQAKQNKEKPLPEVRRLLPPNAKSLTTEQYEMFLDLRMLHERTQALPDKNGTKAGLLDRIKALIERVCCSL